MSVISDTLFSKLIQYKKKHPYLRLGQIISNMTPSRTDVFYVEDKVLLDRISKELEK